MARSIPSQQNALLMQHACFARFADLSPPQQTATRDMFAGFIAENHAMIQQIQEQHPGAIVHNHRLEQADLDNDSIRFFVDGGASALRVGFSLTGDLTTAGIIAVFDKPARLTLPLHGNPYTGKSLAANPSLPNPKTTAEAMREKEWMEQLRALADTSHISIMADFFRYQSREHAPPVAITAPASPDNADAAQMLDVLCKAQGSLWWTCGKTLLLRAAVWYDARHYEIPDRWLLDVSKRLQAQKGVPTYADVLRLLELTPEQMAGLQSGHYNRDATENSQAYAQQKELAAAHTLLELLGDNASPQGNRAPVPTWNDLCSHAVTKTLAQDILTYDALTPQQRSQIPAYLQTQPHQFTPGAACRFLCRTLPPAGNSANRNRGYKNVAVRIFGGFGTGLLNTRDPLAEMQSFGSNPVILTLPLSIPEDRRGNTRIKVTP